MCRHIRRGLVCPSPLLLCLSACGIVSGGRCSLGTFKASRVQDCRPRRPLAPVPAALFSVCLLNSWKCLGSCAHHPARGSLRLFGLDVFPRFAAHF